MQLALKGQNGVMPVIVRSGDAPYRWKIERRRCRRLPTMKRCPPASSAATASASPPRRAYLSPLIKGEAPLPYGTDGLPKYVTLKNVAVKQKLPAFEG